MKVLCVVGPSDAGKTTLVERLAERLAERGRVGTVKHLRCAPDLDTEGKDTARHRAAGAATTYGIADPNGADRTEDGDAAPGGWFATGDALTLEAALDRLAPDHDYVLVEGCSDAALPQVVLGGRDHGGTALASAPRADDVDVAAVIDALEETEPRETLSSLVARVTARPVAERAGAVATFTGRVRTRDGPDDVPTDRLEYEKYEGVADDAIDAIRSELEARDDVLAVEIHHEVGVVPAGEDAVYVVVLAGHRAAAFRTVEDGIDRLKAEVPIFKKEVTADGEFWVSDRA